MPKVDDVVGELETETDLESAGGFTLDRDKARDKLRQFQLPDPRMYVLSLVQVATLKGATQIHFVELDAADLVAHFDGEPVSFEDVDGIYASLLSGRQQFRARQELAIAVNGALALNPEFFRLESRNGETGLEFEARPGQSDEIVVRKPPGLESGTRIHVKNRYRPGLFMRFLGLVNDDVAEETHLRRHCRWSRIEIRQSGVLLGQETMAHDFFFRVELERGPHRVAGGFGRTRTASAIRFLSHGVWIQDLEYDGPSGLLFFVDSDGSRKNVSRTGIVQDEAFEEAMALVEEVRAEVFRGLAVDLDQATDMLGPRARSMLLEEMARGVRRGAPIDASAPRWLRLAAEAPVWPSVVDGHRLTTWELAVHQGGASYVTRSDADLDDSWRSTALVSPEESAAFETIFPRRVDRTAELDDRSDQARRRREFLSRKHPSRLRESVYLRRRDVAEDSIRGEVGIAARATAPMSISLVVDGRLLQTLDLDSGPPGTQAVVEGPFTPTDTCDSAVPTRALAIALHAVLQAVDSMWWDFAESLSKNPSGQRRSLLLRFIQRQAGSGIAYRALRAAGFSGQRARGMAKAFDDGCRARWEPGHAGPHPALSVRLFELVDGRHASLSELRERLETDGVLGVVSSGHRLEDFHGSSDTVVADAEERDALAGLLGPRSLRDVTGGLRYQTQIRTAQRAEEFLRRAAADRAPAQGARLHDFEYLGIRGASCLTTDALEAGDALVEVEVRVFDLEAPCGQITLKIPTAGFAVAIDISGSDLRPFDPGDRRTRERLQAAVEHAIGASLAEMAASGRDERAARCLLRLYRHTRVDPVWLRVYARIRGSQPEGADAAFRRIVRVASGTYLEVVEDQLTEDLTGPERPTAEGLARKLRVRDWDDRPTIGLRGQLIEAIPTMASLPLLRASSGDPRTLTDLVAAVAAGGRVGVIAAPEADSDYDGAEGELWTATAEALSLVRSALSGFTTDGRQLLAAWRRRREFEAQPQESELALGEAVLAQTAFEHSGGRGALGLAASTRAEVTIRCRGRRLMALDIEYVVPITGVVDLDELSLDFMASRDGLTARVRRRLLRDCQREATRVLRALTDAWATADGESRATMAPFVRSALCGLATEEDPPWASIESGDRLAALPVFDRLAGDPMSAAQLWASVEDRGRLLVWTAEDLEWDPSDGPVVIAPRRQWSMLRRLFGRITSYRRVLRSRRGLVHVAASTVGPGRAPSWHEDDAEDEEAEAAEETTSSEVGERPAPAETPAGTSKAAAEAAAEADAEADDPASTESDEIPAIGELREELARLGAAGVGALATLEPQMVALGRVAMPALAVARGERIVVNRLHPVFRRYEQGDRQLLGILTSSVFSAVRRRDDDKLGAKEEWELGRAVLERWLG